MREKCNEIEGKKEEAVVSYDREIDDDDLKKAVEEAGFKVVDIRAQRRLSWTRSDEIVIMLWKENVIAARKFIIRRL